MTSRRGFTLMQLLLVVALVGISLGVVLEWHRARRSRSWTLALALSGDGKMLAVAGVDGTIRLRDSETGRERRSAENFREPILHLVFSPSDTKLAAADGLGNVAILDVPNLRIGQTLSHPSASMVVSVAFSPDETLLATGGVVGEAHLWDLKTGKLLQALKVGPALSSPEAVRVQYSPDGRTLVTVAGGAVQLWDVATGAQLPSPPGAAKGILTARFSPHGKTLAGLDLNGGLLLWTDLRGAPKHVGKAAGEKGTPRAAWLLFSADGSLLATATIEDDDRVAIEVDRHVTTRVWDAGTGRQLWMLAGEGFVPWCFFGGGDELRGLVPAQAFISLWWQDGIHVWEPRTGRHEVLRPPRLHHLLLALACYVWTLAWVRATADGPTLLARLRSGLRPSDYRHSVPLRHTPRAWLAIPLIGMTGVLWALWRHEPDEIFPVGFAGSVSVSDVLQFGCWSVVLGMGVGLAFAGSLRALLRRRRCYYAELAIVKRDRMPLGRWDTFALYIYGMVLAAALASSALGLHQVVAVFASVMPLGLLYWEQGAICRAAEERLAEVRDWEAEKLKYFQV